MKKIFIGFICLISTLSMFGCSSMTNQDIGAMSGAVAGGLLGSQIGGGSGKMVAIGAGTLAGALLGGAVGKSMDDSDKLKMNQAFENNSVGQPAYWQNQRTGASYTVVPTENVTYENNQYCREYRSTANIAGKKQQIYGTACRQPDGTWKIVK